MSGPRSIIPIDGGSVGLEELNVTMTEAAHADDYVLQELYKLPYNGKGILPFQSQGFTGTGSNQPLIGVGPTAANPITVAPFRAMIGPRNTTSASWPAPPPTTPAGDAVILTAAEGNCRDMRSAFFSQLTPSNALGYAIPSALFVSNSSGSPRWDTIYTTIYIDQAVAQTIIVKPATSGAAAPQSGSPSLSTTVGIPANAITGAQPAITVLTGTPAGTPTLRAVPSDTPGSGIFNILLGYVQVPNGFTSGTSTFATNQIAVAAPILQIAERAGGDQFCPAAFASTLTNFTGWGSSGTRPTMALPSTMTGRVGRFFQLDSTSSLFATGLVLDATIDWRNRLFKTGLYVASTTSAAASPIFATEHAISASGFASLVPGAGATGAGSTTQAYSGTQYGQSFTNDSTNLPTVPTAGGYVLYADHNTTANITSSTVFGIYVNMSTGALTLYVSGSTGIKGFVWLEATGMMDNP